MRSKLNLLTIFICLQLTASSFGLFHLSTDSSKTIDHQLFDEFLSNNVREKKGQTYLKYRQISPEYQVKLADYLNQMSKINIEEYHKDEQLPFWINLHNALVIKTILDYYPIETLFDIEGRDKQNQPAAYNINIVKIQGTAISIQDIKKMVILRNWKNLNILYTLCSGAKDSPNLMNQAFTRENHRQLIKKATDDFVNSTKAAQIHKQTLYITSLYDQYKKQFGSKDRILAHLKKHANDQTKNRLNSGNGIKKKRFNWSINDKLN